MNDKPWISKGLKTKLRENTGIIHHPDTIPRSTIDLITLHKDIRNYDPRHKNDIYDKHI